MTYGPCTFCRGSRLSQAALGCKINGCNIAQLAAMKVDELIEVIRAIKDPVAAPTNSEFKRRPPPQPFIAIDMVVHSRGWRIRPDSFFVGMYASLGVLTPSQYFVHAHDRNVTSEVERARCHGTTASRPGARPDFVSRDCPGRDAEDRGCDSALAQRPEHYIVPESHTPRQKPSGRVRHPLNPGS